jgi:hypothetical protein
LRPFRQPHRAPEEIGHKAIARCLSDIGAMGCYPTFAVVAMMIPRNAREAWIKRVLTGLDRTARKFDTAVVGGDVASHAGKLAINVALLGEPRGLPPVRRSGARVGDAIAVTGPLGGSILGKHLRFTPRVHEGIELNRRFEIHSMIDLGRPGDDLATCAREPGRRGGGRDRLPIAPQARRLPGYPSTTRFRRRDELLFTLPRWRRCGEGSEGDHPSSGGRRDLSRTARAIFGRSAARLGRGSADDRRDESPGKPPRSAGGGEARRGRSSRWWATWGGKPGS